MSVLQKPTFLIWLCSSLIFILISYPLVTDKTYFNNRKNNSVLLWLHFTLIYQSHKSSFIWLKVYTTRGRHAWTCPNFALTCLWVCGWKKKKKTDEKKQEFNWTANQSLKKSSLNMLEKKNFTAAATIIEEINIIHPPAASPRKR